jgi:tellurite resistance protein TerC
VVLLWVLFLTFILILLALDLGVFHRKAHVISVREALSWTVVWMLTALAFAVFVYVGYDRHWLGMGLQPDPVERSAAYPDGRVNDPQTAVLKFLTGYLVELSLSADNVFVIAMLFGYFAIPRMYQHRVLFWGILGALIMRGTMIAIGAQLVSRFAWVLSVFGVILILTAAKMLFMDTEAGDPGKNVIVRLMRRFLPLTHEFHGEQFFVRTPPAEGAVAPVSRLTWLATPLMPALVMIEITDLVFAVDSIPAIFAITADPFLVFTSNVFAILGLRSLYFALAGALHVFRYLKEALAIVLLTVGVKMLAHSWLKRVLGPDFNLYLLGVVVLILAVGVIASLIELRWRVQIRWAFQTFVRKAEAVVVPDHLIRTIARAGRRSVSAKAAAAERRRLARATSERSSALITLWRRFFGGNARNMPILLIHQIFEEGSVYALYL